MKTLTNPFNVVKNTRQSYSKFHQKEFTEVEVQIGTEDPAWIPYDTYISMMSCKIPSDYTEYVD